MNRAEALEALRDRPNLSVLVVGGGINGIGTFRDLALNGVDVMLVERGDFCSGASATSSRMAHGGIRYLENGEFRLVREAVRERNYMIEHAPHIVKPLPTTIPIFRVFSGLLNAPLKFLGLLDRPTERGSLVIKLGLLLYDAYTGRQRTVPRHRFMNRKDSLRRWNKLNPAIVHTATYYDGAILQPERLGLELILDAEEANPQVRALNYVSVQGRRGEGLVLRDEITGSEFDMQPKVLVNATGAWIDVVNRAVGKETRYIGGTKGSHIVLDHAELRQAIADHEFFFENTDGRIVLIFPLYDRVLVGTSDIAVSSPEGVQCTDAEVDYFLELVKRVFPTIHVDRKQIVYRFSGIRPLAAGESRTTAQITRDHEVRFISAGESSLPFPVLSLVGGKWTSWRAFSEQASRRCLALLGRPRPTETSDLDIGGGRGFPRTDGARLDLLTKIASACRRGEARAATLLDRYGTRALQIADYMGAGTDATLTAVPDLSRRELEFIATRERVVHLDDVLQRRTNLAVLGRLNRAGVEEIAQVIGPSMGWDGDNVQSEIGRAVGILRDAHYVAL